MNLAQTLENVGYEIIPSEPLETQIIDCFLDMVDGGLYSNLDVDQARDEIESGEITLNQIVKALNRL